MATWRQIPEVSQIPLTTIFTAPDSCSEARYTYHSLQTTNVGPSYFFRAQAPGGDNRGFDTKYNDCYPPSFATINQRFTSTPRGRIMYSPGVCPSGYSSFIVPRSTSVTSNFVTSYVCCPSGFAWENYQACKSQPTTPTLVYWGTTSSRTVSDNYVLLEWPINIAWASSDLDDFNPASAPLPAVFRKATRDSGSDDGGLSTGALAGIGAGVGVLVLALIGLLVFLLYFRKRRRRREVAEIERKRTSHEYQQYQYPKSPQSPPGYESPNGRMSRQEYYNTYNPKVAEGVESPAATSELSEDNRVSELGSGRTSPQSARKAGYFLSPELDSSPVFEVHGTHLPQISHDELGQLGLAPAAGIRGARGGFSGVNRGPSNASSIYSAHGTYDRSQQDYSATASNMQGRWSDHDHDPQYGYGHAM